MPKPRLYLFIGYPGAGKTTVAKTIAEQTGAVHLWADAERHKLFGEPTHSLDESNQLYGHLNDEAERLLAAGQSVVFDTNFNFQADRQKLREIAARHGADTLVIWLTTPAEVARGRAVGEHVMRNGYDVSMTAEQFDKIVAKLEPPTKDEKIIKISDPKLDKQALAELLQM
jgi:predicted kinase